MKFIVNGDDFGLSKAVNIGIIECFKHGILTSTSMMINMLYVEHAVELWKKTQDLSIGLHLNITLGQPISNDLKLITTQDGTFSKNILSQTIDDTSLEEIRREFKNQMKEFIKVTGKVPSHINSHHGLECIPGVANIIETLSKEYNIPIRELTNFKKKAYIHDYNTEYIIPNKKLITHTNSYINENEAIGLFSNKDVLSDGYYELIGHPGYIDYELLKLSNLTYGRCYDVDTFTSKGIKVWIEKHEIELIRYDDLPKI